MRALFKLMLLMSVGYIGYANIDLANSGVNLIRKVQVEVTSKIEMQGIARAVVMQYIDNETLPLTNFSQFLNDNMDEFGGKKTRDRSKDMWGTPYGLRLHETGFEICSAGPDRLWRTQDDLKHYQSLESVDTKERIAARIQEQVQNIQSQRSKRRR